MLNLSYLISNIKLLLKIIKLCLLFYYIYQLKLDAKVLSCLIVIEV